jgi:hypothetical protein
LLPAVSLLSASLKPEVTTRRPDRDAELEKLTEGRVQCFNHEVVPDYLRTKPEPEVEDKVQTVVQILL